LNNKAKESKIDFDTIKASNIFVALDLDFEIILDFETYLVIQ